MAQGFWTPYHIEVWTKIAAILQINQLHLIQWKLCDFDSNFIEVVWLTMAHHFGWLALNTWQPLIWTACYLMSIKITMKLQHHSRKNKSTNWDLNEMDNILQMTILLNENYLISIKISANLLQGTQLINGHHWFRYWLGTEWVTSHYRDQWWPRSLTLYRWVSTRKM